MTGQAWLQYVDAARQLDAVRAAEEARTAGVRRAVAEMSQHADGLDERLREQRGRLAALARLLRLRAAKLTPTPVEEITEPAPALSRIAEAVDLADRHAVEAEHRGQYAAVFPQWPPFLRNLLIYGIAAACVVAGQYAAFYRDPDPNPILVLFLIPLVLYLVGYTAALLAGRPRIEQGRVKLSPRLGLLLCFGIGPVAGALLLLQNLRAR